MSTSGHPGHFMAEVVSVAGPYVVLRADKPEDVEYLGAWVGKAVKVDVNLLDGPGGDEGNLAASAG